jgi:hypothetical protein
MRTILAALAMAGSIGPALATDLRAEGFRMLTGSQIRAAFAGRTFADDVHFSFLYTAAGKIEGTAMGAKVSRRWRAQKDELCETDSFGENCYSIWRKGPIVRFVIGDDGIFAEGTLK